MNRRVEQNRAAWDVAARKYVEENAALQEHAERQPALLPEELALLRPLVGDDAVIVHLQSGHGLDDIDLARRFHATVIGVDFSAITTSAAHLRARQLDLDVRYVVTDAVFPGLRSGVADLVCSGKGAVMWLPDIEPWAREVARLLQPGGHLFLSEAHPAASLWTRDRDVAGVDPRRSYFRDQRVNESFPASAIDRFDPTGTIDAVEWQWTLADVINSVISAGLAVRHVGEYPEPFWRPPHDAAAAWAGRLPNAFSLLAQADG